jgi:predicted DNA-binding antitoxin AbrB/MazE fold protein
MPGRLSAIIWLAFAVSRYTKSIAVMGKAMIQIVEAVFDGTTFHPTTPLDLEAGTRVRITVESGSPAIPTPPKSFLQTAKSLHLQGSPDWSANLDHDLYGDATQEND